MHLYYGGIMSDDSVIQWADIQNVYFRVKSYEDMEDVAEALDTNMPFIYNLSRPQLGLMTVLGVEQTQSLEQGTVLSWSRCR